VTPLVAVLAVFVGVLCLGLGRLGGTANAKARAQLAADAAALAGAAEGSGAARALAAANGAEVLDVETDGPDVQVKVRVRDVEAWARATATRPAGTRVAGAAAVNGLVPELRSALERADALLHVHVPITSGWRSYAEQERLWRHRAGNPYPVARPGTSTHEQGRAVDVARPFVTRLRSISARLGLCQPYPSTDPVHFELCS
jgi:uncharacterized protein YcbK (DUF882 family)